MPTPKTLNATLLADKQIADALNTAKQSQSALAATIKENADALDPKTAAKQYADLLESAAWLHKNQEARAAILNKISQLTGPGAVALTNIARSEIEAKAEVLRGAVRVLLNRAVEVTGVAIQSDLETEQAFFAKHGLPHEVTAVSRRWSDFASRCKELIAGITSPAVRAVSPTPTMFSSVLELFN
jgi:hypothetical protein